MADLSVVHLSPFPDPLARDPEALLDAWFTLADVARAVADRGADVTVLQAAAVDAALERHGVRYRFLRTAPSTRLHRRAGFWAMPVPTGLERALRAARPDAVHVHSLSFPRHVARVRRALPETPILVQDHKERPPPRWLRGLFRRGLASIDGATFSAAEQARPFFAAGLFRPGLPIRVIPETSTHFSPGPREEARAKTGLRGDPALLWVGHLDSNKDPLTVLEAARLAFSALPDPHLWLVHQSEPLREEVERRVREAPELAGRVHLLGRRAPDEVERLLRAADLFVLGSHEEGSGVALIEAMACGTTPVVTDIPSFRELTGHGGVGAVSPPGDAGAMARNLIAMAAADRGAQRRAAREHFESHLSFAVVGRRLVDAYRELGARRERRSGSSVRRSDAPTPTSFGPYRPGDEQDLVRLFRPSFGRDASPEWWRWKLLGHAGTEDTVLVGRDPDGRAVFQMGGIPRTGRVAGEDARVMVAVDALTRPDRRGRGILTAGCRALFERWREQGISLVLGLPNEQWGSRTEALGWRPLFPFAWRVRLLRPERVLARRTGLGQLGRVTAPAWAWNTWWDRGSVDRDLAFEDRAPTDPELETLAGEAVSVPLHALRGGASWTRWRYAEAPQPGYRFLTARRGARAVGWLAYTLREDGSRSIAYLAEITAGTGGATVERALLRALTRRLRDADVELVATLAAPGTPRDRLLRRGGFRPAWGTFVLHAVALDPELPVDALSDPGAWRLEPGDFDVV